MECGGVHFDYIFYRLAFRLTGRRGYLDLLIKQLNLLHMFTGFVQLFNIAIAIDCKFRLICIHGQIDRGPAS